MKIRVRLFARAKELAGRDEVELDLPAGSTVAELRRRLAADYPPLAGLLPRCAVAVDAEFARDDRALGDGAEVALLPPVSGGQE
jgi:molybdopterin converting factor subunit 1